ncbi:hypothetical protein PF003_g38316 [Phytophthora fragariae]|nr:hypothetical protein PF003_g38316 [Phytophthora fragariae]
MPKVSYYCYWTVSKAQACTARHRVWRRLTTTDNYTKLQTVPSTRGYEEGSDKQREETPSLQTSLASSDSEDQLPASINMHFVYW